MPAHINYETTEIIFYRFVCNDPNIINSYVGHTANFTIRKKSHKDVYNCQNHRSHHYKVYQVIRDNGGFDNWDIIEIGRQLCIDYTDARKKEQEYIEYYNCDMNSRNAYTNRIDYFKNRVDIKAEYDRKRRKEKLDEIKSKKKQYRLDNYEKVNAQERASRLRRKLLKINVIG